MPMMPFIGVRISWLMLARNSLLAWFASSATWVAATSSDGALAHLAIEILGERAQLGVEPLALDQRLFELPVRVGRAGVCMPLTSSSSAAISAGGVRRSASPRRWPPCAEMLRTTVTTSSSGRVTAPRKGAGAEHRAAERQQHQSQGERVVAGRLQPDVDAAAARRRPSSRSAP